jgi:hypothetical protein
MTSLTPSELQSPFCPHVPSLHWRPLIPPYFFFLFLAGAYCSASLRSMLCLAPSPCSAQM